MQTLARQLRQAQTPAEQLLWRCLRNHHQKGYRFRRQQPIGSYIVDFCCFDKRLVIEVDGDIHSAPEKVETDQYRQAWLEQHGFQVLRFTNEQVLSNLEGGVALIGMKLRDCP